MLAFLKIKIKSLAAEAKFIRRRESCETILAQRLRFEARMEQAGLSVSQRRRIINRAASRGYLQLPKEKRKQRSFDLIGLATTLLALTSVPSVKKVRDPEWLTTHERTRLGLYRHRVYDVRREARLTHLTYGFLRGVPYRAMEQKSYSPPPWLTKDVKIGFSACPVERMALKFGELPQERIIQRLAEWKQAAGDWIHPDIIEEAATRPSVS